MDGQWRGSNVGDSFKAEHGIKKESESLEMWLEKERRGSRVTPKLRTCQTPCGDSLLLHLTDKL